MPKTTAVARISSSAPSSQLPTMATVDVVAALQSYREIQRGLDAALGEDALVQIGAKKHRTKTYWNAIGTAFQLELEIAREDYVRTGDPCEHCLNSEDWGYVVTVIAHAPDGRKSFGDGACFASEKIAYRTRWEKYHDGRKQRWRKVDEVDDKGRPIVDPKATREARTVHNVRSTAMTRARNRAISNLVGFGEVSAEEMPRAAEDQPPPPQGDPQPPRDDKPVMATQAQYQTMETLWREKLPGVKYETLHRQALGRSPRQMEGGGGVFERLTDPQMRRILEYLENYTAHQGQPDGETSADPAGTDHVDAGKARDPESEPGPA